MELTFFESVARLWIIFVTIFYFILSWGFFKTRFREILLKIVKAFFYIMITLIVLAVVTSPHRMNTLFDMVVWASAGMVFSLYFFIFPMGNYFPSTSHIWEKSKKFAKPIFNVCLILLALIFLPAIISIVAEKLGIN
ncbi:hypothetical protein SAMN05444955_11512 [Lihuaxuella thermophila]|uniref:Uncharacterized protein n=1 Tax=Lihuaxuella thermophila TaxID=1173111 RepID=A0A1H8HSZ6_9BACL|nr:hypothetical protein SAMN05444955_11512 [Lihuaxuella thermophila]